MTDRGKTYQGLQGITSEHKRHEHENKIKYWCEISNYGTFFLSGGYGIKTAVYSQINAALI